MASGDAIDEVPPMQLPFVRYCGATQAIRFAVLLPHHAHRDGDRGLRERDAERWLRQRTRVALRDEPQPAVTHIEDANERVNEVVLTVGAAFGEHLVRELGFEWCIATDDWGTDIAVRARPGCGDVTIFPTDYVAKRWERKETGFLATSIGPIAKTVEESASDWGRA